MIKFPNTFYEISKGLQNSPEVRKLIVELDIVLQNLRVEACRIDKTEDILRHQGSVRLLEGILEGFEKADSVVSRINGKSGTPGPSNGAIT